MTHGDRLFWVWLPRAVIAAIPVFMGALLGLAISEGRDANDSPWARERERGGACIELSGDRHVGLVCNRGRNLVICQYGGECLYVPIPIQTSPTLPEVL